MTYKTKFGAVLILDIVSALSARQAFITGSTLFTVLSILSLTMAGYLFIQLMKDRVGLIVNITWVALGTMNVTIASYLVFGEKVTLLQGVGMAFIVTGIILVEVFAPPEPETEMIEIKGADLTIQSSNTPNEFSVSFSIKFNLESTREKTVRLLKMYP